jgi:hypothetical protein
MFQWDVRDGPHQEEPIRADVIDSFTYFLPLFRACSRAATAIFSRAEF